MVKFINARSLAAAVVLLASAAVASAQTGEGGSRGSTPPGTSRDGAGPAGGAIQGGSIVPGESGGVPQSPPGTPPDGAKRCEDLSGTLREQCRRDEQGSGSGGTAPAVEEAPPPRPEKAPRKPLGPAPDVRG